MFTGVPGSRLSEQDQGRTQMWIQGWLLLRMCAGGGSTSSCRPVKDTEPQLLIHMQGTQTAPSEDPQATVPYTHMCLKTKLWNISDRRGYNVWPKKLVRPGRESRWCRIHAASNLIPAQIHGQCWSPGSLEMGNKVKEQIQLPITV